MPAHRTATSGSMPQIVPAVNDTSISVDTDDPPRSDEQIHALLRFDDIFGGGPSQIPLGQWIP
jgi:hypothetical protein